MIGKDLKYIEIKITVPEFAAMMKEVDAALAREKIPIHNRPIRAVLDVSKRLNNVNILLSPAHKITNINLFTSHNISTHINEWYSARYGDRLKIHMGPGSVAIMIREDAWNLVIPLIIGRVPAVCDPAIDKYKKMPKMSAGGPPPILNILNCIDNMTEQYASQLSREELDSIMNIFGIALSSLSALKERSSKPYIKEAVSDLSSAVHHIFSLPPHHGLSKWSSLQFTEKLLKSFLKTKGVDIPHIHKLHVLSEIALKHGLPRLDTYQLNNIQCDAGVRYGESAISLRNAIDAHHASIKLANIIAMEIEK